MTLPSVVADLAARHHQPQENDMNALEDRHRVALARELTYAAGVPLRDRYGFAASDETVRAVVAAVFANPDDEAAVMAIFSGHVAGEIELADGYDTPTDEAYELRIVAALRPLTEQRRDAAVRSPRMTEIAKHSAADGCYFCASDEELAAGLAGQVRRTLHMQLPVEACPNVDPADFAYPASPVLPSGGQP